MTAGTRGAHHGAGLGFVAAIPTAGPAASGDSYTFTKLADTSGDIAQFKSFGAALNNNGEIAFRAHMDSGGEAIIRTDGKALTVIASTADFFSLDNKPDINDAGLVGFGASVVIDGNAHGGVYTGDGETITVIGPPNPDPLGDRYVFFELNNSGLVMMGEDGGNGVPTRVAIGDGGPISFIYGSDDFNGNGALFVGDLTDSGLASVIAGPGAGLRWYLFVGDVVGSPPTCVVGIEEFNAGLSTMAVNNNGIVVFAATHYQEPQGYERGVYLWTGGLTGCDDDPDEVYVQIAHDSGLFYDFDPNGSGIAINDSMTVAFKARLDAGGEGIYTGPDPGADKVIAVGDELDGATVVWVSMNGFGLNNAGEIALMVGLSDGRTGMYLASPVIPCPEDVNGDDVVDFGDLLAVLAAWGQSGVPADVNGDGIVDFLDLLAVLAAWGPC